MAKASKTMGDDEYELAYDRLERLVGMLKEERKAHEVNARAGEQENEIQQKGRALIESVREPYEIFRDELLDINALHGLGALGKGAVGERNAARAREAAAARYLAGMPEYRVTSNPR